MRTAASSASRSSSSAADDVADALDETESRRPLSHDPRGGGVFFLAFPPFDPRPPLPNTTAVDPGDEGDTARASSPPPIGSFGLSVGEGASSY
jgi:hypothetical protein